MANKEKVLARLHFQAAYAEELRAITGLGRTSVASIISRLRSDGWVIQAHTQLAGNPLYELLRGPNTLTSQYVCPYCAKVVSRWTTLLSHEPGCALREADQQIVHRSTSPG